MLNRSVLIDNNHVRKLCDSYKDYYNTKRPHQGIDGMIPFFPVVNNEQKPDHDNLSVEKSLELNGLVTHFKLAA